MADVGWGKRKWTNNEESCGTRTRIPLRKSDKKVAGFSDTVLGGTYFKERTALYEEDESACVRKYERR